MENKDNKNIQNKQNSQNKPNSQNTQNNQNNQNNQKNGSLFPGVCLTALGIFCLIFMKEDVYRILGLFEMSGKTLGIISLVIGGWELLKNDDFGKLLGEILALPFRLLGWLLKHWYVAVAVILLLFWLKPGETAEPEKALVHFGTEQEQTAPAETDPTEETQQGHKATRRNGGVCKNLTQDAKVLLVFVNDNESSWTRNEINRFISDLVDPALEYIEYHAGQYGYSISLEDCSYYDNAGNIRALQFDGTISDGNDPLVSILIPDMLRLVRETYGFSNDTEIVEDVRAYSGTEQVAVVFCLDKPGRSFSNAQGTGTETVESSMLYTSYKGADSRASVFAHELMHLFGAEDMYGEDGKRENRYAMAKAMHPNELFCGEQWNLYDNTISSFTAYAVGWLDTLPAEYDVPEWWS